MESLVTARQTDTIRTSRRLTAEESIAARSVAPLLITAPYPFSVRAIARRVHAAGPRAAAPLLHAPVVAFPHDVALLRILWATLLERAAGGSLLLTDLEDAPATVQERLVPMLDDLAETRRGGGAAPVRLMGGTTAPLFDRIARGTFSDRLYYRLNVIHLQVDNAGII